MTTWAALFILALGAMFLVSNESGMIAGLDSTTFGYVAVFLALIVYLGGGMLGSYSGRTGAMLRDAVTWQGRSRKPLTLGQAQWSPEVQTESGHQSARTSRPTPRPPAQRAVLSQPPAGRDTDLPVVPRVGVQTYLSCGLNRVNGLVRSGSS